MHMLSTMLMFWAGVSAASLAAAVLVVAVEVCTTGDDFTASAVAPACRVTPAWASGRSGKALVQQRSPEMAPT